MTLLFAANAVMRLMNSIQPVLKPTSGPNAVVVKSTGPPESLK